MDRPLPRVRRTGKSAKRKAAERKEDPHHGLTETEFLVKISENRLGLAREPLNRSQVVGLEDFSALLSNSIGKHDILAANSKLGWKAAEPI